jgi:hypothetical protein
LLICELWIELRGLDCWAAGDGSLHFEWQFFWLSLFFNLFFCLSMGGPKEFPGQINIILMFPMPIKLECIVCDLGDFNL